MLARVGIASRINRINQPEKEMARADSAVKPKSDAIDVLLGELKEIYSAESQLAKSLPRLARAAESEALKKMLEDRLEHGERLIDDLDRVFEQMDASPGRKKNAAAEGLISEAREHVQDIETGPALDIVLIGAIRKTEHYCIGAWDAVRQLAAAVREHQITNAMERALEDARNYDLEMTRLAETEITPALLSGEENEEAGEAKEEAKR